MKKMMLSLVLVGLAVSSVALASNLAIPFFQDNSAEDVPTAAGNFAEYIGVKNTTSDDITVTFEYTTAAGVDMSEAANTYVFEAGKGLGFRPYADSSGGEGPGFDVPGCTATGGSVTMWFFGKRGDLIGRLYTIQSNGASAYTAISGPLER